MTWTITLPDTDTLEAAFEHPQLLKNPIPVKKVDGGSSAFARFKTLAAVVTVANEDWIELSNMFRGVMGIASAAVAQDYVKAVDQTLATLDRAEGSWDDNRADLEVKVNEITVKFEHAGELAESEAYYGYVVQAPFCRWDRFVDDVDLVTETTGRVRCEQLFHDVNGAQLSRGIPRETADTPTTGFDYYEEVINVGVGKLAGSPVTHHVKFNVTMLVTTPGDSFWDLIQDLTMLWETDPRMATRLPELKLLVAAGGINDIAERLGISRARLVELLKRRGLAPEVEDQRPSGDEDPPKRPRSDSPLFRHVGWRITDPIGSSPGGVPFFRPHVRTDFVPKNRLAAAFVSLIGAADIPRVPAVLKEMHTLRLRRLAAGLGMGRDASVEAISAYLLERVFVTKSDC